MVRILLLFAAIVTFESVAQEAKDFQKDGMIRATATFAVGKPFAVNTVHAYLKGELEYQLQENWSIRGDVYVLVGQMGANRIFKDYHSASAGASWHFTDRKALDPYVGLQVGVLWSDTHASESDLPALPYAPQQRAIDALISPHVGFNYYASNYFHLFANLRYLYGQRLAANSSNNLSELRLSFGLGFNILAKKRYTSPK
jgi:hypothetical protein